MRPPPGASILAVMLFVTALTASVQSRRVGGNVPESLARFTRGRRVLKLVETAFRRARPRRRSISLFFGGAAKGLERRVNTLLGQILNEPRALLLASLLLLAIPAQAQIQSETRFEYDDAGNIVRILTETNDAPPTVSSITPNFINRGSSVFVVALGNNLVRADVVSLNPDLIVDRVVPTLTSVRFRARATLNAPIGPAVLEFSTRLGTASAEIFIAERTPIISTSPNPIVLPPDGIPTRVTLLFESPFDTDQAYQVSIRDTSIATVQETSVALPAGEREVAVNLTGVSVGNTTFDISQPENFIALGIPVIVSANEPPPGTYPIVALPVGVVINIDRPLSGPLLAEADGVGIVVNIDRPFTGPATGVSNEVGVVVNVDQPLSGSLTVTPPDIGVAFGATGDSVSPSTLPVGSADTLTIAGSGLDDVTDISFFPGDGITAGLLSVNLDGTALSVPVSIDASAPTGVRAIVLITPAGDVAVDATLEIIP